MPNANYLRGVRFERERQQAYEIEGWDCMRTAGSHGGADLIAISPKGDVRLIQCKVTSDVASVDRLFKSFRERPPFGHRERARYHQVMEVKIKGSKEIHSWTI